MNKLSKSESGRLGALKTNVIQKNKKQERIALYLTSPTLCNYCNHAIDYSKRKNRFCSRNCAASFNNLTKDRTTDRIVNWTCAYCNTIHTTYSWRVGKYCNSTCQKEYEYYQRICEWKETGIIGKNTAKRYLSEKRGGCWECGTSEWNGKPLVLELEHIDGDASNNSENNLSLLCPNCHSQTNTFKGRNIGKGRHFRRLRYAEGKSY